MIDPDNIGPLAVRFYQREVQNEFLTQQEGRPISVMRDFVRIEIPGNNTSVIDTFANDDHKKRFPIQWAQFMNEKAEGRNGEDSVQGTLLRDWPLLTSAQASELKHYRFYTVEQVANASDQQINALGMVVGMSPYSFRDKAKAYLSGAKDSAVVQAQADELRLRDQQIADLKAELERISRQVDKKPGRPPKEEKEAA